MVITFLIGNGFDLNLGLKTQYNDFLNEYKNLDDDEKECIRYFKEKILKDEKMWSSAEEAFGKCTKDFKETGYDARNYCECHEDFCRNLAEYLKKEEQKINYTEKSSVLAKQLANGVLKYKRSFRESERTVIEEAEKSFGKGITFNFINFNYTETLDLCVDALKKVVGLLGTRTHANTTHANTIGKIIHVHGTIHRDMVLGVNDMVQIADSTIFDGFDDEYISQVIKQKTNEINGENTDRKVHDMLKNSDFIYIYGMAIGKTDKLWWERICNLMNKNNKIHLFIHKYDAPQDDLIRRRIITYSKEKRAEFTAFSELNDDAKKDVEQRIHIDCTNIFEGLENLAECIKS